MRWQRRSKDGPAVPIHAVPRVFERWPPKLRHAAGYLIYTFCNWVKYDAKLVRSHNQRIRSTAICKAMKRKHGQTFSEGKENVRAGKLHGPDQVKYAAYEAVQTVLKGCTSLRKLAGRLKERGVTTRFIHRGGNPAEEVQGSIFTMNGQTFKASKADRKFSYANLCRTIEKSRVVANTAKKVMERTEIDGRKISEYLTAAGETSRTGKGKIIGQALPIPSQTERQKCTPSTPAPEPTTEMRVRKLTPKSSGSYIRRKD